MDEVKENNWLILPKKQLKKLEIKYLKFMGKIFLLVIKKTNSPLTIADQHANDIIESYLLKTNIPILSEEGKLTEYKERKKLEITLDCRSPGRDQRVCKKEWRVHS